MTPAHPAPDLGTLIGARGPSVHWGRLGLFAAAWILAGLVWILIPPLTSGGGLAPLRVWMSYLISNALLVGCALVGFRWVRNDFAAAAVVTLLYAVVMLPINLLWTFSGDIPYLGRVILNVQLYRVTSTFLSFAGLALALTLVRPVWLALGAGGLAAAVVQVVLMGPIFQLVMDGGASLSGALRDLPLALAEPILFAGIFGGGLELGWVAKPDTAAAGEAPPVGMLRMSKGVFVGVPATCFGIALPLVIAGNLMARSEPRTALSLLGLSVPVMLAGAVVFMVFFYRMWAAIQDGHARTTPGRALGLLFIPFYNLYWVFQVLPGFAKDYNSLLVRHGLTLPPLPVGLFTAYIALSFASAIPVLGLALVVVNYGVALAMISKTCDAVNALPAELAVRR